jgi:hypothetical protein
MQHILHKSYLNNRIDALNAVKGKSQRRDNIEWNGEEEWFTRGMSDLPVDKRTLLRVVSLDEVVDADPLILMTVVAGTTAML